MMKNLALFTALGILLISSSVLAEEIRYDSGGRRDPFIPLVTPEGVVDAKKFSAKDLRIEGIIYDPNGGSMVLINGEFYKQGENVNGANVITIFRDRVVLSQSDEEKTLWIREEIVDEATDGSTGKTSKKPVPVKAKAAMPKATKKKPA